jgi:hypothetical protein
VILPLHHIPTRSIGTTPRRHCSEHRRDRPPLRAACSPCFIPGHDSALGELAMPFSLSLCFPFVSSCSVARDRLSRPWRRRGESPSGPVPAGAPPAPSPIQSGSLILNPTAVI